MKRFVLVVLAALLVGGCGNFPIPNISAPTEIIASPTIPPTLTETPLPTVTSAPPTEAFFPTAEVTLNPTITPIPTDNLTTTPVTATSGIPTNTPAAVSFPSSVTPTPTNGILTYGTLPPAVPFKSVTLWNRSKVEAYISLQQQDGKQAIIEYPVSGQIAVDVPLGHYIYVAWVGGNKMTGKFSVERYDNLSILLFKDKIVIQNN